MSLIGLMMSCCPICGEVAMPLESWKPIEHPQPGGGVRIEGTPCYCACNREAAQKAYDAKRGTKGER